MILAHPGASTSVTLLLANNLGIASSIAGAIAIPLAIGVFIGVPDLNEATGSSVEDGSADQQCCTTLARLRLSPCDSPK